MANYLKIIFFCWFGALSAASIDGSKSIVDPVYKDYVYLRDFNEFVKIKPEKKTWKEAEAACAAEGASLGVIRSSCEAAAILKIFPKNENEIWVGLHDHVVKKRFETIDGEPLVNVFGEWAPGEPNDEGGDEDCVAFDKNGKLNDEHCGYTRFFLCKKDSLTDRPKSSCSINAKGNKPKVDPVYKDYVYLSEFNEFVKINKDARTWDEAKAYCEADGASLGVVRSSCEALAILKMYPNSVNEIWVGLHDHAVKGKFETVDGEPISNVFGEWAPGEPNDEGGDEDCVALDKNGKLNDEHCHYKRPVLCKKNALVGPESKPDPVFKNYIYLKDFNEFARIYTDKKTQDEAKAYCEAEGASLAVIRSKCEVAALLSIYPKDTEEVWIDLQDKAVEGTFVTSDGEPISKLFGEWAPGEPNNDRNDEDCVALNSNGKLNDETCSFTRGFICKKDALVGTKHKVDPVYKDYVFLRESNDFVKINTEKKTWDEAAAICAADGAGLGVIRTACEASALLKIYPQGVDEIWIDLGDKSVEGRFETSEGEPISKLFGEWAPGEPNNDRNDEDCVALNSNGKLNDETCSFARGFYCKKNARLGTIVKPDPVHRDYVYLRDFNEFVKIYTDKKTQDEAKAYCEAEGASLAVIRTRCEASKLFSMYPKGIDEVWIDLQDKAVEGRFETSEGEPISKLFGEWAPGEPNNDRNDEDCVALNSNGKLNDETCSFERGFICKKNAPGGTTYRDYVFLKNFNKLVKVNMKTKTWFEARAHCKSEDAKLVVLRSQCEASELLTLYHNEVNEMWIGLNDFDVEGKFETDDGEPIDRVFGEWAPGEPNNERNDENCAALNSNAKLNDETCSFTRGFICEKDPRDLC